MSHAIQSDAWRSRSYRVPDRDHRSAMDRFALRARQRVDRVCTGAAQELATAHDVLRYADEDRGRTDEDLRLEAEACRIAYARGKQDAAYERRTLRLIREVVRRTTGLSLHPPQLAAGLALSRGRFVEMQTGEGKTITATIPAILYAWRGRGCHVLTANDYLVERDRDITARIYCALGLTVSNIVRTSSHEERRVAYNADITYSTPREACADHLRDRLQSSDHRSFAGAVAQELLTGAAHEQSQRSLHAAIVDEADALLIDEGTTPLVLSTRADQGTPEDHENARRVAAELVEGRHYTVRERHREVELTRRGRDASSERAEREGGASGRSRDEELVLNALRAQLFYKRDRDYVVRDARVVIVDPFTGRTLPDRTWRHGVHQAVESIEGLEPSPEHRTTSSLSFQRFIGRYQHVCGMSGTLREVAPELHEAFGARTVVVPTHRPEARTFARGGLFVDAQARDAAVVARIIEAHTLGQPVLVGTRSVGSSERLSAALHDAGLEHRVLNAVRHHEEAEIIAHAGTGGAVTVATNMAGRGTDIPLDDRARAAGGLHVIVAEMNEAFRVDRQLLGRAGRQGDLGSGVVYASLDDDVLLRSVPHALLRSVRAVSRADGRVPSIIARAVIASARYRAQRNAATQRARLRSGDDRADDALAFTGAPD